MNQHKYFSKSQTSANREYAIEVHTIEHTCVSLLPLISDACAQTRRDEILPSVGTLRGRIPAPASTSPTLPKTPLADFGDIIVSK
jgi:hypothetical protein